MKFGLVLHAHQPPGNFDRVFEEAVERCYQPVLDLVEAEPDVRLSMHWSGSLLEWLEQHSPTTIDQIRRLVGRGQVELLCAGMYEPVLALLPRSDRPWQVATHREMLRRLFDIETDVGWLTERVWEPELAEDLAAGGIRVLPLDEAHLVGAGLEGDDLDAVYLTEGAGMPLRIVPASEWLRMSVPWTPVDEVLARVAEDAASGRQLNVYADDLEKFGLWPDTYRDVIEGGWLAAFLRGLATLDDVETAPLGEIAATSRSGGRTYIPDNSYREMLEWSLPPAAQRRLRSAREQIEQAHLAPLLPYVRAGQFRLFMAKYPEVNHLQKRMLHLSRRVHRALASGVPPEQLAEVRRNLGRAQANCAYWHGLFGGTYLPHLRQRLWHHLLLTERDLDALDGTARPTVEVADIDADGRDEVLIHTDDLVVVVAPAEGCVVEVSHRRSGTNLADTLARRPEAYHEEDAPPEGWDRGRRGWFVDQFWKRAGHDEADLDGMPYVNADAEGSATGVTGNARPGVRLTRTVSLDGRSFQVEKQIEVQPDAPRIAARYRLDADTNVEGTFSSTVNLGLLFNDEPRGRLASGSETLGLPEGGTLEDVSAATVMVDGVAVEVRFTVQPPCTLDVAAIETLSRSESEVQRSAQQLEVRFSWPVLLSAAAGFESVIEVEILAIGERGRRL